MKLILDISNNVLIFNEDQQATILQLLSPAKLYRSEGWGDCTYHPVDDIPKISFVKDSQIKGYEEALEEAKKKAQEKQSEYYALYNKNNATEKQLKELQEKMNALQAAVGKSFTEKASVLIEDVEDF